MYQQVTPYSELTFKKVLRIPLLSLFFTDKIFWVSPMVREKDVCWDYADKLDGNKVRCKFCLRVLNGGISRLKHHLSRLPSKGVNPCSKVRDDVTDRVRALLAFKDDGKEAPVAKKQKLAEERSPISISIGKCLEPAEPPPAHHGKVFPTSMQMMLNGPVLSDQESAERCIALFFFENKLEFSAARSSTYQQMIDAIAKCGGGFTGPSPESLKTRARLKHMFTSPEFSANSAFASKPQSLTCIGILDDNDFWRAVDECVSLSEPFLKVMREILGGKPAVGFIYELMTRAKESIRTYYIMDEIKCATFLDIVDNKWHNNLHSPLHSAAAFLNPSIQYNPEIKFIGSIKEDFYRVLEKLLPTPELRRDITNQILLFTRASGMFGCNLAKEAIDTVPPEVDLLQLDDIDMSSEWVEETENSSPTQWLDRFGSALDGNDLNTRQFSAAIFGASDHIFGL
ncbi:OLC1v1027573C1 [Oldenlandia corymbosa var. corymbosa]|uniref:OLC1v1027573C1 n=1 Tax=Oldenlandia corymbosa var. corymbosa TaxID=529605 RepID=A0AAV1CD26_OLDCO|nr:OLC1v1027573C1 [Oldenlandia corymbosa var. corymbosa]